MAVTSYFFYEFSNGKGKVFTPTEARQYAKDNNCEIVIDGLAKVIDAQRTKKRIKNGFQAGYHPAFKQHVRGYEHFKQLCKEFKMDIPEKPHTEADFNLPMPKLDHETAKEIRNMAGCEVSDNALDALIKGERLTNIPVEHIPDVD